MWIIYSKPVIQINLRFASKMVDVSAEYFNLNIAFHMHFVNYTNCAEVQMNMHIKYNSHLNPPITFVM